MAPHPAIIGTVIRLRSAHHSGGPLLYAPDIWYDQAKSKSQAVLWKELPSADIESKASFHVEAVDGAPGQVRLRSAHWGGYMYAADIAFQFDSNRRSELLIWRGGVLDDVLSKARFYVEGVDGAADQLRLRSVHFGGAVLYAPEISFEHDSNKRGQAILWRESPSADILSKARFSIVTAHAS